MKKPKVIYRRHLPHIQPQEGVFFATYLLHNAIPAALKEKLKAENELRILALIREKSAVKIDEEYRRYFKKFDDLLDKVYNDAYCLKDERLAKIVSDCWHYWDGKRIELIAYCIMPNHVHVVFCLLKQDEIGKDLFLQHIMETVKKYTARQCNLLLGRTGQPFWQHESYDRVVRDQNELYRIIKYILDNPVKAGFCPTRQDWKWSYVKEEYNEFV